MAEVTQEKVKRPPARRPGSTGRRLLRGLVLLVLAIGGAGLLLVTCTEYVAPYETGIKESKFGGGIKPEVLQGGRIYLTGPGVTIHRFPATMQSLQMSSSESEAAQQLDDIRSVPAIEIDTSDGSKVKVDVTILYRIVDAYKLITGVGKGRLYENSAVIPKAVSLLKKNLGVLLAEDFYNEIKRIDRTNAAREELNVSLADKGLQVEHVLIRQYYYEAGYQKQIEERKVKDQLVFTNQSAAEAAKEDAKRRKIISEGEAAVAVEQRRGEAEITRIRAEADLYARKQRAEGDLLVAVAQAQGTELENSAYEGVGSPNLVAEQMAEVLKGVEIIVMPSSGQGSVNPLDLDALTSSLGAR